MRRGTAAPDGSACYFQPLNVASERLRSTSASVNMQNISLAPNQLTTRRQRTKLVLK